MMTDVRVRGSICLAVGQACVNLHFFADDAVRARLATMHPDEWYPLDVFLHLLDIVTTRYVDPAPILEQVGVEFARLWYEVEGKHLVHTGVEFLRYQTSSAGYRSVVQGDPDRLGEFTLTALDEQTGTAQLRSTTPFPKDFERGVLRGGLQVVQDIMYVDVDNSADPHCFNIEFH
jgi:hypothetical protein